MDLGNPTFGALLRRHRENALLTQEGLAERAGVGVRTINDLEHGHSVPRQQTVELLITALSLPDSEREQFVAAFRAARQAESPPAAQLPANTSSEPPDNPRWGRIILIAALLLILTSFGVVSFIFPPTVVIDSPRTGAQIDTTPDCMGEIRGRVTGILLPGSKIIWEIYTNAGYPQGTLTADRSFRLHGYFAGIGDYNRHDVQVKLSEFFGLIVSQDEVTGIVRVNSCTNASQ